MYRIIQKRGTGKTTNLITLAKETGATLVVKNPEYVVEKMYRLGITGIEIISYVEYEAQVNKFVDKQYIIDELDEYLKYISGNNIIGYSINIGD